MEKKGFALVATILLMVLLAILALGMLSLSSVSIRTTGVRSAEAEARANARMALMIAIGRLQAELGPDQRISANGAIVTDSTNPATPAKHPHWTGAWDSWKAGPSSTGSTDGFSAHSTIAGISDTGMAPTYQPNREDHFRSWLVSVDPTQSKDVLTARDLQLTAEVLPETAETAVKIVAEGSLGSAAPDTDHVAVPLVTLANEAGETIGRYGWWVGDESQKAMILKDSYNEIASLTNADHIHRSQAPGAMATKMIEGLQGATNDEELDKLPSLRTLDLVTVDPLPAADDPAISERNFHHIGTNSYGVLSDVREGGLKRDLSTILEQPIQLANTGDEYMLYRFDSLGEDRVPIQDLSAYYQLYQNDPTFASGKRGGIVHKADASRAMQVNMPDLGNASTKDKFTREYTTLYRSPIPIRVQFVVGVGATEISPTERTAINDRHAAATPTKPPLRDTDKYKMLLGIKPVVSLWNPNNTPLVMGTDASQIVKVGFPPFALRWLKYQADGTPIQLNTYVNLNYAISNESTGDGRARSLGPYIMQMQFARTTPIVFQPGEVKMFSIPIAASNFLETGNRDSTFGNVPLYQAEPFLPDGFYVTAKTAVQSNGLDSVHFPNSAGTFENYRGWRLVFGDGDRIDMEVVPEASSHISRAVSSANEVRGSGFQFGMADSGYLATANTAHFRNYQFISRFGGTGNTTNPNLPFNASLMLSGFPDGAAIPYEGETNAILGTEIKSATDNGEAKGLLLFTMMSGAEVHTTNSPGAGAGRRITTRPFLHGSTLSAPQITDNTRGALYDYGWEWQVEKINEVEEAFQDDGASRGYYGGGYTVGAGVTHVVQQYLPALPPISIASLSNARLGGFSLADAPVMATKADDVVVGGPGDNGPFILRDAPGAKDFRQVTATGQGGLAPHNLQSVGNSYAHPNIPANKAFTTYTQLLNTDTDTANPPVRTYADHSYLANKALWDEFYFSSIAPQPSNQLNGGASAKTATEVANAFFFNDGTLPNRRILPYSGNLTAEILNTLTGQLNTYTAGFADKIASHLMVAGPFNINSTSVEAWKVFFSSLKGKPLAHLENQAATLATASPAGVPATPGMLANGEAINSSDLSSDPNDPPEQWTSPRVLSDTEIDELALAMVEQVKTRGPFLSLSEFINRRLDGGNEEFALKGALQAALDDDSVSINEAFRTNERSLDNPVATDTPSEIAGMTTAFTKALEGPIAYGSTPYVDQADLLRHMGSILTPRGDTFVIRTYGDSIDRSGNIAARAWCEAVVQRIPDYVDGADANHLKQSELTSESNKTFGRLIKMVSFRWLNADEV